MPFSHMTGKYGLFNCLEYYSAHTSQICTLPNNFGYLTADLLEVDNIHQSLPCCLFFHTWKQDIKVTVYPLMYLLCGLKLKICFHWLPQDQKTQAQVSSPGGGSYVHLLYCLWLLVLTYSVTITEPWAIRISSQVFIWPSCHPCTWFIGYAGPKSKPKK